MLRTGEFNQMLTPVEPSQASWPAADAKASIAEAGWYAGLFVCVMAALLYTYGWSSLVSSEPIAYKGDALQYLATFRAVFDSGWYTDLPRLGAPLGTTHHDFPIPDGLFLAYVKVLGFLSREPGVAYNTLFFSSFFLVAFAFYYAARKLSIPGVLAFSGALAYSFLPFHYLRLGHLFYTLYFVHPLILVIAVKLHCCEISSFRSWISWRKTVAFLLTGCAGVYGAFFAILVMMFGGASASVLRKSRKPLIFSAAGSLIIGTMVLANLAAPAVYKWRNGDNPLVAKRQFGESEVYALKLSQLLLPPPTHPIQRAADAGRRYSAGAPLINENSTSYLGLIGSVGLLWGFAVALLGVGRKSTCNLSIYSSALSRTNIFLLLFATVGGFSSLFAFLISPQLRAWNRISVVIAAASILTLLVNLAIACRSRWIQGRSAMAALLMAVFLATVCFFDQIPKPHIPKEAFEQYRSDRNFVNTLAERLPEGGMVFQLPYVAYPESKQKFKEGEYALIRPFIHGTSLRWSYGGMKGRFADLWRQALDALTLSEQLRFAAATHFAGVLVHRAAYADGGASVEKEIAEELGDPVAVSEDGSMAFFVLPTEGAPSSQLPVLLSLERGFFAWEKDSANRWAWSMGDSTIRLMNPNQTAVDAVLEFGSGSNSRRTLWIQVDGVHLKEIQLERGRLEHVSLPLTLNSGYSTLRLMSPEPAVPAGGNDPRDITFSVLNPKVSVR